MALREGAPLRDSSPGNPQEASQIANDSFPHDVDGPDGNRAAAGGSSPDMQAHALALAAAGLPVIPLHTPVRRPDGTLVCDCRPAGCNSPGKHPRTRHGKDDATTDAETITRWWGMWPDANIGVRPIPGLVVLDIDPRNGGDRSFAELLRSGATLSPTRAVQTGSGGWHLWYALRGETVGRLADGIDVKGPGGYLVAPPSLHACGGRYRWFNDIPVAPATPWLASALALRVRTPGPTTGARSGGLSALVSAMSGAREGNRNLMLFWAACRAFSEGLDPNPIADAAVAGGLDRREVERTVQSAYRRVTGGAA